MHTALLIANLAVGLMTAAFAVFALARPGAMSHSPAVTAGERFYTQMYAARALPLGLAAGILPFLVASPAVAWVLVVAALAQIGDVAVGVRTRQPGQVLGAVVAAAVHVGCALALL